MICKYCKKNRPKKSFSITSRINGKTYRRLKCQQCKSKTQKERIRKTSIWFMEYKKQLFCSVCNLKDYRCLDFHHIGGKDREVSDMMCFSIVNIKKEIDKCIVLCSNCHRIKHYEEKLKKLGVA